MACPRSALGLTLRNVISCLEVSLYNCGQAIAVKPVRLELMPHVTHIAGFVQLALVYV